MRVLPILLVLTVLYAVHSVPLFVQFRILRGIDITDNDPIGAGESDPFVEMKTRVDNKTFCKTPTIDDTASPVWDFTCEPTLIPEGAELYLVVFDEDLALDDELGRMVVTLPQLNNIDTSLWGSEASFSPERSTFVFGAGTIVFSVKVFDNRTSTPPPAIPMSRAGNVVQVNVLRGLDIVANDPIGQSDPFVRLTYGVSNPTTFCETPAVQDNANPVWSFMCPAEFINKGTEITFILFDEDVGPTDDTLGRATITIPTGNLDQAMWGSEATPSNERTITLASAGSIVFTIRVFDNGTATSPTEAGTTLAPPPTEAGTTNAPTEAGTTNAPTVAGNNPPPADATAAPSPGNKVVYFFVIFVLCTILVVV